MEVNKKYQEEFSNYLNIMNEALKKGDFKAYGVARDMLDESIDDCKHEKSLMDEMKTNNFGVLNHIFESQLPMLIKRNKKAVKAVINTIKEDVNLKGQFAFYEAVKGQSSDLLSSEDMLKKIVGIVSEKIDKGSVKESNKKLRNVMLENGVVPTEFVDGELKKLDESGDYILTKKESASNIIPLVESYKVVSDYMDKHKGDKKDGGKDIDTLIEEFEHKMKETLTESEISFVQELTDFRSPIAEQRKEKLFNKLKKECIEKVDGMLKEDSDNDELKGLKKQLEEQTFNKDSVVKDVAKLLEIRDILMDD